MVIQAERSLPALDMDTILFLDGKVPLGQVFETFGPVAAPLYSVRFNSTADIRKRGIKVGMEVFYAPEMETFTKYVFMEKLRWALKTNWHNKYAVMADKIMIW